MVEPDPTVRDGQSLGATKLRYEVIVVPKWSLPSTLVSQLVKAGLPANICAIAERAEQVGRPPALLLVCQLLTQCMLPCLH